MNIDKHKALAIAGLVLIAISIFAFTVKERRPWFGVYSGENHDWLTASTVMFTDNWYREGIWNLRFGMYEEPESPELSTQISRDPYLSYPSGSVIPVYLVGLISGHEPTAGMVMGYDLFNHLLVTIVLVLTVFFLAGSLKLGTAYAFSFAMIPIFLELLLPSPFYYFQNSFFSDQAVILPFVLVILIEVLRDSAEGRRRQVIDVIQGLVFFYGTFTDWFFVFVFIVFYLKRLLSGEISLKPVRGFIKNSVKFAAGVIAGVLLFFIQMIIMMWHNLDWAFQYLDEKFLARAGMEEGDQTGKLHYIGTVLKYIGQGYGSVGKILVYISILFIIAAGFYLLVRRLTKKPVSTELRRITQFSFVVVAPCILQILVFLNHSAVHSFSVLKLSVVISLIPFIAIPLFCLMLARDLNFNVRLDKYLPFISVAAVLLASLYAGITYSGYKDFFAPKNEYWYQTVSVTTKHTLANDIVFSPDLEIPYHPPQLVSMSRKRVYKVSSVKQIKDIVMKATGDYRVVMIFWRVPPEGSYWSKIVRTADSTLMDGAYYVYFSPRSFMNIRY